MTQKLIAPEGSTSVTFDGESFEVVDGIVEVPGQAVAELLSHGYTPLLETSKRASRRNKSKTVSDELTGKENEGSSLDGESFKETGEQ